jgi:hypothetical protein
MWHMGAVVLSEFHLGGANTKFVKSGHAKKVWGFPEFFPHTLNERLFAF